jgi:hypothetical protein
MSSNNATPARPAPPPRTRVRLMAVLGGVGLYFSAEGAFHRYQMGEATPARLLFLLLLGLVFLGALLMIWEAHGERRRLGPGFLFLATLRLAGWLTLAAFAVYVAVDLFTPR